MVPSRGGAVSTTTNYRLRTTDYFNIFSNVGSIASAQS